MNSALLNNVMKCGVSFFDITPAGVCVCEYVCMCVCECIHICVFIFVNIS
jgi:hypothetical protein